MKNFGFAGETTVVAPGINSKMDDVRAAYGLLNLKQVDMAILHRKKIVETYREALKNVKGIRFLTDKDNIHYNYAYFPIFIDSNYDLSRDALYNKLKEHNIFGRRYFYPLISTFSTYKGLESANPLNLPIATKMANQVICLPIYADLQHEDVQRVIECIVEKK